MVFDYDNWSDLCAGSQLEKNKAAMTIQVISMGLLFSFSFLVLHNICCN